ncbi:hypothetical protein ElyMa_006776700 [Elysia marginata]|uniref:Uncharacterized protein n=1 Tax=Elysia marginata TaxID=1093978 RepID=A0AAV4J186_9GAST|nr:hypothetical protein ElyMa_006776700 [Elysia marginata]
MSNFEYVFAASSKKLPFLHDKFKPRSKFAKAFSGCKKYSKLKQKAPENEADVTRLPRITYDAQDSREAPPTFGSVRRGARREYPGFTGNAKILRPSKNAKSSVQSGTNGDRNASRESHSLDDDDGYLAFPSPLEQNSLLSKRGSDERSTDPSDDWKHSQTSATRRRDQRLVNGNSSGQATQNQGTKEKDPNFKPSELISDMDSLFIGDDTDDTTNDQSTCQNGDHGQSSLESSEESTNTMPSSSKGQGIRFADNTRFDNGEKRETDKAENNPFAKNFEEKLREIRGKSGVKRERERKRLQRKKRDGEVRPLGDLITSKRLQELLSPHNAQGVTIRLHS